MAIKLEEIEDRLNDEAEALRVQMQGLRREWALSGEKARTAIEEKMQAVKAKAETVQDEIVAEMERAAKDSDAIITAYGDVVNKVGEDTRAMIERDAVEAEAAATRRAAKLAEAGRHIKEVLRP
jgi:uncharacterized membrane-anchored protein YhcB (DUF1043 family)